MVQIVGKYQHLTSEGLEEFLVAVGTPPEQAKAAASVRSEIEFKEAGGSWTIVSGQKGGSPTFKLGEAYDEPTAGGNVMKSVTVREGDKITTTSEMPDGNQFTRAYEFNDAGGVMHLTEKKSGKQAKFTFKRI